MENLADIINCSQPTRDAEVVFDRAVSEEDVEDVIDFLLDHLPVGGTKLTTEAQRDQYMLISRHDPATNVITISWATPPELKKAEPTWTLGEVYEYIHPSKRKGYEDWEAADYGNDEDL
jgi:hypothetical protein